MRERETREGRESESEREREREVIGVREREKERERESERVRMSKCERQKDDVHQRILNVYMFIIAKNYKRIFRMYFMRM